MSELNTFDKFMEALVNCDTVKVILTGCGEAVFDTRTIYEGIRNIENRSTPDMGNLVTEKCYDAEFWGTDNCTNTKCPYYSHKPCPASDGCGGYEGENKPLTLEELREMDGEPVWICNLEPNREYLNEWHQFSYEHNEFLAFFAFGNECEEIFRTSNYNKTWLAYRRKPEAKEEAE